MAVFTAAAAGVSLASAAYSQISGQNAAATQREYAKVNSANLLSASYYNNLQATDLAGFSAQLAMTAASVTNEITSAVAERNAEAILMAAAKNTELLEREAEYVYQQADLNIFQREQQGARTVGSITAAYGASGAQLNIAGDAPMAGIINTKVQNELDTFIIRHGANIQAGKLLDAAATSEWEGQQAANTMLFEAYAQSIRTTAGTQLSVLGSMMQTQLGTQAGFYNATIDAMNVASGGAFAASQASQAGTQGMFSGLMNAAAIYGANDRGSAGSQAVQAQPTTAGK